MDMFPPESDWVAPTELPSVPDGATVALDCETCDRGLQERRGPGWVHRDGWLCGVSWAVSQSDGGVMSGYAPVRHPDTQGCFAEEQVGRWAADLLSRCEVVFQNASYDLGWMGLRPERRFHDTHTAGVLLDENRLAYGLDVLCRWQGVPGKDEKRLREAAAALGVDPKGGLWRLPAKYVGPYAEADAVATLMVHQRMQPQIIGQGLEEAYALECDLAPWVMEMRRRGIRVDVDRAEALQVRYRALCTEALQALRQQLPAQYRRALTIQDVRSPRWLEACFQDLGLDYPRTAPTRAFPTGNPSFEKEWLERHAHPAASLITRARGLSDAAEKFMGNYILDHLERGRIHAEIHQLRDADEDTGSKGTRSWRFSYSNPPLQQMTRPDPDRANPDHKDYVPGFVDMGSEIRECFLPESGEVIGAPDYSQQEMRRIVHVASLLNLEGADKAVSYYQNDPDADYHNMVRDMTGLPRKRAKDCNFAKAFGAGIDKFADMANLTVEEAREIMSTYDRKLPFVSLLADKCKQRADQVGFIRLSDGRRCRFELWEPGWQDGKWCPPCDLEEAKLRVDDPEHPWHRKRLRRAYTHKAGNRRIQGDAAIQTKRALLAQAREGYVPLLQIHDELVHSVPDPHYARRIVEIMESVETLVISAKADAEFGPDWGHAKYTYEEACRMAGAHK